MITQSLKLVLEQNQDKNPLFVRNLLKEQLQYYVLNFIYNSVYGENFILKGGTCLRFCFEFPRLSEDLDFDVKNFSQFNLAKFRNALVFYFRSRLRFAPFSIKIAGKNKLIYLQFPVLKQINFPISKPSEDILFVRIDLAPLLKKDYKIEVSLKSTYDFSFIIKRFSLPDLFAGKIRALLQREKWEKEAREPRFKGRDFFDLWWFLEKNIRPNYSYLKSATNLDKAEIKNQLVKKVKEAAKRKKELEEDLLPFFSDADSVFNFVKNLDSLVSEVKRMNF